MMIAGSGPRPYGALVVFSYAIGPVLIIFSHACSSLLISTGINLAGLAWPGLVGWLVLIAHACHYSNLSPPASTPLLSSPPFSAQTWLFTGCSRRSDGPELVEGPTC